MKKITTPIIFGTSIILFYVISLQFSDSIHIQQTLPFLKNSKEISESDKTPTVISSPSLESRQTETKSILPSASDQTSSYLPPPPPLSESTFKAISFNNKPITSTPLPTLSFTTSSTLNAQFCNSIGGEYTDTHGIVTAPHLIQTLMYCTQPDNLMDMEASFVRMLQNGASYERNGSILTIQHNDTEFVFERI